MNYIFNLIIVGFEYYTLLRGEGGGVLPVVRSSQEQRDIKMVPLVVSERSPDTVPRVPSLVAEVVSVCSSIQNSSGWQTGRNTYPSVRLSVCLACFS